MRPLDVLGIATLSFIWGTNFLLVEEALEGLTPAQIVTIRLLLGSAALVALVLVFRARLPRSPVVWLKLTGMGLLGQGIPLLLFARGQQDVSSALAGVYTGLTPLLVIPVAWLMLRKRPSLAEVIACVVGFAGLVVVLAPWTEGGDSSVRGQLLCLAGAGCYAAAYGYAARLLQTAVGDDRLAFAATQALAASAIMLPGSQLTRPMELTGLILLCLALLGAGTAVAFLVNYWLIARIGPVRSSLAFYLIPVVAVAAGVVVRGERLTGHEVLGSLLVVAALGVLYTWERAQERRAAVRQGDLQEAY